MMERINKINETASYLTQRQKRIKSSRGLGTIRLNSSSSRVENMMAKHSKRFKYYQPNKKDIKDKVGDCQIRALSKALNKTWIEVFDIVTPICREQQVMDIFSCDLAKTKEAMKQLGFNYTGISNKRGTKRPTVDKFAKEHQTGVYVVTVAHHVVAVVDGMYYDTWDSGDCSMYGYYELVNM